jgi:hypothetical protein
MVNAGREEKLRASAQRLIDEAAQGKLHSAPSGEVVFRKPKFPGYVFLVLFVVVFLVVRISLIYSDNAFYTAVRPMTATQVSQLVLLSLLPLSFAIRQFRYRVRVSQDELTISDLTTKTVPLRGQRPAHDARVRNLLVRKRPAVNGSVKRPIACVRAKTPCRGDRR